MFVARNVWEDLNSLLRKNGWINYALAILGTNTLILKRIY